MTTTDDTLADVLRERYGPDLPAPKQDVLWAALMVCHDCPHRMIDHDEVAMRCTVCRCNQSSRGLSSRADERLRDLGVAIRDAWPTGDAPTPDALREALALLDDALTVQRFPCDHRGIGKPGCVICDPRVYPEARAALTTPEATR
jgi:hypothetical protein